MSFVVPIPGKVEPFWVSKLVADKVEVPLTPHPVSDEPDHLVECQATANDVVGWPQPITSELRDINGIDIRMGVPLSYVDIPVYISLSMSQKAIVLSPTRAWSCDSA